MSGPMPVTTVSDGLQWRKSSWTLGIFVHTKVLIGVSRNRDNAPEEDKPPCISRVGSLIEYLQSCFSESIELTAHLPTQKHVFYL